MSVKQNGMRSLDIWSTTIHVGSLNHQNIYIIILIMCLHGQLFEALKRFI